MNASCGHGAATSLVEVISKFAPDTCLLRLVKSVVVLALSLFRSTHVTNKVATESTINLASTIFSGLLKLAFEWSTQLVLHVYIKFVESLDFIV